MLVVLEVGHGPPVLSSAADAWYSSWFPVHTCVDVLLAVDVVVVAALGVRRVVEAAALDAVARVDEAAGRGPRRRRAAAVVGKG